MLQFRIFDIIAKLVPGILIVTVALALAHYHTGGLEGGLSKWLKVYESYSEIAFSVFFVIAFIAGYLVNALSSQFEWVLWEAWGGRPSSLLLRDKVTDKPLNDPKAVLDFLKERCKLPALITKPIDQLTDSEFGKLFQTAKRICLSKTSEVKSQERIEEFLLRYVFARNMFFGVLVSLVISIVLSALGGVIFWIPVLLAIAAVVLFYRCKKQAIYHTREVFDCAVNG